MAFFAKEDALVLNVAQVVDLKKVLNGFGAESLVYMNDDAGANQTVTFDDGLTSITVPAGEQRVVTGLSGFSKVTIGGDGVSQGPYRLAVSSELQPPIIKY